MTTKISGSILNHKIILIYLIFSLFLCHLLTYHYTDKISLDLRLVPFIIGGLYFRLSPILLFVIILLGIPHGIDAGFFFETIVYSILGVLFWFMHPWFLKMKPNTKVLLATLSTLFLNFLLLELFIRLVTPLPRLDLWFTFISLPTLIVAVVSYIFETIKKNSSFHDELIQVVELETIQKMTTAISHDIRNPLTTAIGYVELLANSSLSSDKRNQYLTLLGEELSSAESVTKDFLSFSKPAMNYEEELDIKKELELIIKLLEPLTNFHSVEIISELNCTTKITGNKSNFHQCIINILKYMIEFSSKNNLLKIKTKETKKNIFIHIKDAARVLTKKQIQEIEDSYFSTMSHAQNRSLNFMVAKSIIQSMTGKIHIKSQPILGTIIQISFPISDKR